MGRRIPTPEEKRTKLLIDLRTGLRQALDSGDITVADVFAVIREIAPDYRGRAIPPSLIDHPDVPRPRGLGQIRVKQTPTRNSKETHNGDR